MISNSLFAKYASSPSEFRNDLVIDCNGIAKRFGDVMDDWQRADFAALDPALMRCCGRGQPDAEPKMRALIERPRGASKTNDIAVMCVWALCFATRPLKAYAYAADKDQSKLLLDAIQTICRLNGWIGEMLTVEAHRVVNTAGGHPGEGGTLSVESSQIGSSFGTLGSLYVADELTHWPDNAEGLWTSITSSAAKRADALLMTITNAGYCGTWQHRVREIARTDPDWIFSRLEGHASWISQARLDEQKRMLPAIAYARLWENQWASSGGDALLPSDIEAAFQNDLTPMTGKEQGFIFVGGLDLGLTRDCSAFVVLAVSDSGRSTKVRLAHAKLWRPLKNQKLDLVDIAGYVLALDEIFSLEAIGFDVWQAEHMAQTIEANSDRRRRNQKRRFGSLPFMRAYQPTSACLREQATAVLETFADRRLACYPCEPLKQDLLKLRCEERPGGGFRLTSPRDSSGHGDSYSAFALSLLLANEYAVKRPIVAGVIGADGYGVNTDQSGDFIMPGDPRSITQGLRDGGAYDVCRREFEQEQAEYAEEQRLFSQRPDDQAPFKNWMRENTPRIL